MLKNITITQGAFRSVQPFFSQSTGVPNTQTDRQTPRTVRCMRYGLKDLAQTCWLSLVFLSKSLASDNMATTLHRRRSEGVNQVAAGRGQFRRNSDNQRF